MTNIDLHQPINGQFLEERCRTCNSNLFRESSTGKTYCPDLACSTSKAIWSGVLLLLLLIAIIFYGSYFIAKDTNDDMANRIKSYQIIKK